MQQRLLSGKPQLVATWSSALVAGPETPTTQDSARPFTDTDTKAMACRHHHVALSCFAGRAAASGFFNNGFTAIASFPRLLFR